MTATHAVIIAASDRMSINDSDTPLFTTSATRSCNAECAGVTVHKGSATHLADLTVAEESAERQIANVVAKRVHIVIANAVEVLPAAGA